MPIPARRLPAVPGRHRLDAHPGGAMSARTRARRTPRWWATWSAFDIILPGSDDVYNANAASPATWEQTPNEAPNMAYIGWGVYVMARSIGDEQEEKGGLVRGGASRRQGPFALGIGLSLRLPALSPDSHFNFEEWEEAGYDRAFIEDYLGIRTRTATTMPNAAIEPRIPGIFQYYSVAEDELAKGSTPGQYGSAQEPPMRIAAAWEKDHRSDRPRQPDCALQARHSASEGCEQAAIGGR